MKKALYRTLIAAAFTLIAVFGWQGQPVRVTHAVEIQPGSSRQPENSDQEGSSPESQVFSPAGVGPFQASSGQGVAVTNSQASLPTLEAFIQQVRSGQAGSVRGLYVPGLLALRVVQQPDGQVDFISYEEDSATEFQSPGQFGVIGLLAHNFLSGRFFFQILPGQILTIVYGDGQSEDFQVAEMRDFERLSELDLHSDFRDLQTDQIVSADQVFRDFYQGDRRLTLQTCLERGGNWNWGIRMITAFPLP